MNRGKTIVSLLIAIVLAITLCACSTPDRLQPDTEQTGTQSPEESAPAETSSDREQTPENPMAPSSIVLTIGDKTFSALLEDSETTRAFLELLPLTLEMSELNGNEKFYYMDDTLPTNAENPGQINAGDLMLYGNNCLVLFFDTFSTSYSYTRLGSVTDASGLVDALDSGTVTITFAPVE